MKTGIPKGTRDFGVEEMKKREFIFDSIRSVFKLYGYQAIETPAMELLSTLMGKYGEEGDKLLFKILNSGDYLEKLRAGNQTSIESISSAKLSPMISEKGLRYDLTVPLARFVVEHQNELVFPFKRFQIQSVWRADKPQRGRYREFYQCDVDVIGSNSLVYEAELISMIRDIFNILGAKVIIKINNRKILNGIAEAIDEAEKFIDITVAIDKLEKIGIDKVCDELQNKGILGNSLETIRKILEFKGENNREKLDFIGKIISNTETGQKGIQEMEELISITSGNEPDAFEFDITLARGLNYYTGTIFEVKAANVNIGSICGGGRYDDLTGVFGLKGMSGVGISFGADRIYDVLSELNLFPVSSLKSTKVLIVNFGKDEMMHGLRVAEELRKEGISTELYPDSSKMKKQMSYANDKNIPFVLLAGTEEISSKVYSLKNMTTGEQLKLTVQDIIKLLKNN